VAMILKLATAITIKLGPFLDPTDGVTPVTGLAGTMDVQVAKNGGSFATRNSATAITHDADGFYNVALDATDTGTPGRLNVMVSDPSSHLPVWCDFMVAYQATWDSFFGGTELVVNMTQIGGSSARVTNMSNFFSGTGYNAANSAIGSASTVNTVTTVATVNALSSAADNSIRDAVASKEIEVQGGYTIQQALSIMLAVLAGVTDDSGATIKTPNGAATRVSATLSSNERSAMTLTPSS
jgi:hypothetical protein